MQLKTFIDTRTIKNSQAILAYFLQITSIFDTKFKF
jgi:hypothetical protein